MPTHLLRFLLVAAVGPVEAMAEEPLAKGIQDNSFLVEEAYNQEPGVVQHIFNLPSFFTAHAYEITPSFTQGWPVFSQTRRFSNDLQIVAGAAAPIGISSDSPDWGLFFYLSFEHAFVRPRNPSDER